jgi:hypothetical protein
MMYETYLRQLFRLRTEYWQTQNTVLRNLKLSRMVLFANACGVDLIEFLAEEAPDKSTLKAESEPKATVNAKKASLYQCHNCDFTTDSPKALSGHQKKHSRKYQPINA